MSSELQKGTPRPRIAIVGGGPAGLRAAEVAAERGAQVTLFEAKRAVGRKFLVAGRSGLNLTNDEEFESFLAKYGGEELPVELWHRVLGEFDAAALRAWAAGLGVETFVSSGGKVLPVPIDGSMKATPLLRRWLERLRHSGVVLQTGHRWLGFGSGNELLFESQAEAISYEYDAAILALGGGSWPKTGSTGSWVSILEESDIRVAPLRASNCGWEVSWPSELLAAAEGLPLKNLSLNAGESSRRGELVITRYGLEGGPIYRLGPMLRSMREPQIVVDFKPDQSRAELITRMGKVQRNFVREAGRRLKLDKGTCALLKHLPSRGPWKSSEQIVDEVKACRIDLTGPRPIAEAISSAGGVHWSELDDNLMLTKLPHVYVAGEMIDWDAPTGGYLLQACFATGAHAARAATPP